MVKLSIKLPDKHYPIYITTNFENLAKSIKKAGIDKNSKIVIITDTNVARYYANECSRILEKHGFNVHRYIVQPGEKSKSLETISDIYRYLLNINMDRSDSVLALGGGVVGDITGFVAATFLRGLHFIQVPTSLLAQVDSSIGGKVGVNFEGYKNIIGTFYQPQLVYINVNSLKTLPLLDIKSGMAEVLVHAIIKDKDFFYYIKQNIERIFNLEDMVLQYLIKVNCSIKGRVVEQDERDKGIRVILNFGHTIGHAIEAASGFRLLHGECVSIGIVAACKMAFFLNMIEADEVFEVRNLLIKVGLAVKTDGIKVEEIYNCMLHDKKIKNGKFMFILPKSIGEVVIYPTDDNNLIKKVINEVIY